jgi:hypothetical protein
MSELYGQPKPTPGQIEVGRNGLIADVRSGQIVIIGDCNFFLLDKRDRVLVDTLVSAMEAHARDSPVVPPTKATERKNSGRRQKKNV